MLWVCEEYLLTVYDLTQSRLCGHRRIDESVVDQTGPLEVLSKFVRTVVEFQLMFLRQILAAVLVA